jgi:hypothetical protein
VDAQFTGPNRVEIRSSGVDGLTLRVSGHPRFAASRPVEVVVDGHSLRAQVKDRLSLRRGAGGWTVSNTELPAGGKRAGAEGPMSEVIAARHIYVYGTGGSPSREELARRRAQAAAAADWPAALGGMRPLVSLRVVADNQVRPSDLESANLVLFGTKETNSLIAKFAERLPIHLNAGAEGYGLAYVYPVGQRYVLVSSGLPWWESGGQTGAAPAAAAGPAAGARRRYSFLPGPPGALAGLPDFVLFQGRLGNVVAEGSFDKNWRLSEADAAKLRASGVVTLAAP